MQLSGSYRLPISFQSGCQASFNCSFGTGSYQFGLTGISGGIDFYTSGSKIFDKKGDFIYSTPYQESVFIETKVNGNSAATFINGELISSYTGFFSPITGIFSESSDSYKNDFLISGELPLLEYSGLSSFGTGINVMTGVIINLTPYRQFQIKDISINANSIPLTYISGWDTGNISSSGKVFISSDLEESKRTGTLSTKVTTNFGEFDLDIDLSTNATDNNQSLSLWPSDASFGNGGIKSYILQSSHSFGSRILNVELDYISGGTQYPYVIPVTGMGTGYLTGNLVRFGNISGAISGMLQNNVYETGFVSVFDIITGHYTGNAHADLQGQYSGQTITQTAVASGYDINFTSGDLGYRYFGVGTGMITGIYSHVTGSGNLNFSITSDGLGDWTGAVVGATTGISQSQIAFKASFSSPLRDVDFINFNVTNGDDFTNFSFSLSSGCPYFVGIVSGEEIYSGYAPVSIFNTYGNIRFNASYSPYTGNLNSFNIYQPIWQNSTITTTGSGNFGSLELSKQIFLTFNSGLTGEYLVTTGTVPFYEIWNVSTGSYIPNLIDFKSNGWHDTGKYFSSGSPAIIPQSVTTSIVEISYDGSTTSGFNVANLKYSDGFISGNLILSGVGKAF